MKLTASTMVQLQAFEAVGRLLSFTRAAEELFVTQAAVSHHVRHLEDELGVQLVRRLHRRIELTGAGAQLFADSSRALKALAEALKSVQRGGQVNTLTIGVSPYFALRWLTPRLGAFWSLHPDIRLLLHPTYQAGDFLHNPFDAEITWGSGNWPGVESTLVMKTRLTPLCTPDYWRTCGPDPEPRDLLRHHLFYDEGEGDWQQWLRAAGVADAGGLEATRIGDLHALRQVVLDGQGFGLFYLDFAEEDLRTGSLVQPFKVDIDPGQAYYLNHPKDTPVRAALQVFMDWILKEAKQTAPGSPGPPLRTPSPGA